MIKEYRVRSLSFNQHYATNGSGYSSAYNSLSEAFLVADWLNGEDQPLAYMVPREKDLWDPAHPGPREY